MADTVLITGGTGLLALNWGMTERKARRVILGLHSRRVALAGVESRPVSLETADQILRVLDETGPQLVVHTAGLTSVETCEANPGLARLVNVDLAANVARACARNGVRLVHISTDHLFANGHSMMTEDQPPAPLNVYGITKAEAEQEVLRVHPAALVVRTNFYGWGPGYRPSFSDRVLSALRSGNSVDLFHDVFFTPILIERLVGAIHDLVAGGARGIHHVVGDERISKHDFGIALADAAGLDTSLIMRTSIRDRAGLVRRPHDMSLSNAKACTRLGRRLGPLTDDISRLLQQETQGLASEIHKL